jgi:hypothetical protein
MAIKYTDIFRYKTLQKFTQNGIFGLKIYHLAALEVPRPEKMKLSSNERSKRWVCPNQKLIHSFTLTFSSCLLR